MMRSQLTKGQTIRVKVTASNGYNVATLPFKIAYTGDPASFIDAVREMTARSGYTSILHYSGELNYIAKTLENPGLAKTILGAYADLMDARACYKSLKYHIEKMETEHDDWADWHIRDTRTYEFINIEFNDRCGCWTADGRTIDDWWGTICHIENWMDGVKTVLEGLGYDPEDNEAKRRICENLGLYRV